VAATVATDTRINAFRNPWLVKPKDLNPWPNIRLINLAKIHE
jgi:hypothetical protein